MGDAPGIEPDLWDGSLASHRALQHTDTSWTSAVEDRVNFVRDHVGLVPQRSFGAVAEQQAFQILNPGTESVLFFNEAARAAPNTVDFAPWVPTGAVGWGGLRHHAEEWGRVRSSSRSWTSTADRRR